ncbi:hypothetical protein [Natronorubrum sp. FCH18a]
MVDVWTPEDEEIIDELTLNVKAGGYFQITVDNFVGVEEKQAF